MAQVRAALAGRYRIDRELGHGGMAVAYLAENLDFRRLVAIKVLRPDMGYEGGAVERFRTEAVAVAQLQHPHIIGVHARGEEGEILWFEMDFIDGGSLEDKITAGPISPKIVARYVAQAADALAYAHASGIIHRDIKPSNLLITRSTGHLVVTDFGVAKIIGKTSVTETGMTVGTLTYMSPEQLAADRNLTSAADQYSLGVVAYQALTGILPFEGTSPGEFIAAQQRPFPAILTQQPDCPPDLDKLIRRMLAPVPHDRWRDMLVVQRAAEEIALTGEAPSLRDAAPPSKRRRPSKSGRRSALTVTIPVVVLMASLGWFGWHRRKEIGPPPTPPSVAATALKQPADTGHADSIARAPGDGPAQKAPGLVERGRKPATDTGRTPGHPRGTVRGASTPVSLAADTQVSSPPPPPPPPPPAPAPTTAVLSITSKLPGTFVYIEGQDKVYTIPVDRFVDITVAPGRVHMRVRSNQAGCKDVDSDIVLTAGEHKNIQRNASCPNL